ncbi:MAG TPA: condensation domain-containing protein, partial [Thermodesulfovibrionia bacterium]|nr:condensation domain-containing protein [Thermodesulfovibrionia bacterium]
ELQASLNLQEGHLMRAALFDFGAARKGRLLIVIHHLAVDGVSWRILLEDLQTACSQLAQNQPAALPSKTTSYKVWAENLTEYAGSEAVKKEIDYWLKLSQIAEPRLPVDYVCDDRDTVATSARVSVSLDESSTRALLQDVPQVYNTRIEEALLTALVRTMNTWTGTPELLVNFEGHGREELFDHVEIHRTVGWFTTIYPVWLSLQNIHNQADALKSIKEQMRNIPNRGIGYGIMRYLSPDTEIRKMFNNLPKAGISFNYLGQIDKPLLTTSLFTLSHDYKGPEQSPKHPRPCALDINAIVTEGRLQMEWTYSTRIHRKTTVESLTQTYINNLKTLISHCQSPDAGGFTPSDFPGAKIGQKDLDKLMSKFK